MINFFYEAMEFLKVPLYSDGGLVITPALVLAVVILVSSAFEIYHRLRGNAGYGGEE